LIDNSKYSLRIVTAVLVLLAAGYIVFEYFQTEKGHDVEVLSAIHESLENAEILFNEVHNNLQSDSEEIYSILNRALETGQERMAIHNRLNQFDLWGITVQKNQENWLWTGFNLQPVRSILPVTSGEIERVNTSVVNYNNVTLLIREQFFHFEDDFYTLITAKRIAQTTDLPFIKDAEFSLTDEPLLRNHFPVEFQFFGPIPNDSQWRKLSIAGTDSVGVVYANPASAESFFNNADSRSLHLRLLFQAGLFIAFFLALFTWSAVQKNTFFNLFQIIIIGLLWILTHTSGLIDYWVSGYLSVSQTADPETSAYLGNYIANSVFLFLIFLGLHSLLRNSKKPLKNEKHYRTFLFSLLIGALAVFLLLFFQISTQTLIIESNLALLDLELAPDRQSFTFYIFSAIFFTAASGIIITAGYHLYYSEEDKSAIIAVLSTISFIGFYFLAVILHPQVSFFRYYIFLHGGLFLIFLFIIHAFHQHSAYMKKMSGFRKLMILVLVVSSTIYFIIWDSMNTRMDRTLLEEIHAFTEEETIDTRDILFQLLSNIESHLSQQMHSDLSEPLVLTRSQFQRAVQANIQDDWRNHSFHLKLLSPDNNELTSYSTSIQTPAWSQFYNTDLMIRSHRGEQIRWQTNRPIIWGRPSNISERYTELYRGWIPLYDPNQPGTITAWIAGDAFIERIDYNKPLRAVLSAATASDFKQSIYLAEYLGDRLTRSTVKGIYQNQPQYNSLLAREAEISRQDSISFIRNITSDGSFREVIVRDNRTVIKASTPLYHFNHHLFSYFRLQIVLVFFGLFCFSILGMIGFRDFSLFGQNRKFRDRLVDGLTLATILFLTALIFATQYAVSIQNEKNVERELVTSLGNITESLKEVALFTPEVSAESLLSDLTTTLNLDLVLYQRANVAGSTTPQIFQQYLMPASLPYPVYDFLFNRERRHYVTTSQIGSEELLIGYRSILDSDGFPIGTIAIPTFIQSPVYKEQLLETTSYLFVVYLFIFALFILGTVFLSTQLTKPLQIIQAGLNKISRGDMNTQVAVTSQDEIGSLANAYNTMVQRLDHAQKELMKAEREAAWQEMAQQVAHEIKNPLTPMKLNLQHLQRQLESHPDRALELKPAIEKTASNIIEQIESLNKIASDFSKFAKPVRQPLEDTDLISLIHSVADLYQHDIGAEIHLSVPDQTIKVQGVEDELRRSFINLVKNAIEASGNGQARVNISLKKNHDHVLIEIKDNGTGIDEADRDKIFLPKFSTKSSGTGLGLAITKKIIEAHHGDIWFESKKGHGSSFFIRLPLG